MAKNNYVRMPTFEEYKERFRDHMVMERTEDGIIMVRLATKGDPVEWSYEMHNAMSELWTVIGHDKGNELLILTGTDPFWIGGRDGSSFHEVEQRNDPKERFDVGITDTTKIIENFVMNIDIPTIGVLNGRGFHWDAAVLCDITLSVPDFMFSDGHFQMNVGTVPGDGMTMLMQHFMGYKRANYMSYMSEAIDAKTAQEWGLITEVVEKEKIMDRAWEIARKIMSKDRIVRRLTHSIAVRPLKRRVLEEIQYHVTAEMYGVAMLPYKHDFDDENFLKNKGLK